MSANLFHLLLAASAPREDAVFLELEDRAVPYAATAARSAELAGALQRLGVEPGERVFAQVGKSPDAVALYLACLRLGAVYVPLNPAYTDVELAYFLEDARPRVFVASAEREAALATLAGAGGPRVCALGTDGPLAPGGASFEAVVERAPDDVAAMLYTSGTTGRPKGAMLTHRNLAVNARALVRAWGWRSDDVLLHALPIFHVHGLFVALHCAMLHAGRVLFLPRFEVGAVRAALPRATVMMGVPTFYTRLLAEPDFGASECAGMRLFISGSAPMPEPVFAAFERRTGHAVVERYGMTETGILTSSPLHGERVGGSVGFPLEGVELRVVDDEGGVLPPGAPGQVEVRGETVFAGYWRQPEKTARELRPDGFFRTGDVGELDLDGRLRLAGRASDLIISGGYNVYPKEVELSLDAVPGVAESAVVGVPHRDLGEGVLAFVVPDPRAGVTEAMLRAGLEGRLARFKQPRRYVFVEALPRNAMGKVQKKELRERAADAFAGPPTPPSP